MDKQTQKFYIDVFNALIHHINFATIKVILFGSPTATIDDFFEFALNRSVAEEQIFHKNKSKVVKMRTSTGTRAAVEEMLGNNELVSRLSDVKAVEEVRILKVFRLMLDNDPLRTCYGLAHVTRASEQLAIESLLIIDKLYRSDDYNERNKFVELMDSVKHAGGKVFKFSSLHVSGEELGNFTGIAAILRFPMYDEDEHVTSEEPLKG